MAMLDFYTAELILATFIILLTTTWLSVSRCRYCSCWDCSKFGNSLSSPVLCPPFSISVPVNVYIEIRDLNGKINTSKSWDALIRIHKNLRKLVIQLSVSPSGKMRIRCSHLISPILLPIVFYRSCTRGVCNVCAITSYGSLSLVCLELFQSLLF